MGVRGLQTFIEKHCPEAFELVDIHDIAERYRQETGEEPIMVIDVASCIRHFYCMKDTNWILGGQYKELVALIQKFISIFMSIGIQLVLFFDGMPVERKHDVWVKRRMTNVLDVYKIYDYLYQGDVKNASDKRHIQVPPCAFYVVKTVFSSSAYCKCYTSIREADEEIAEYAGAHNCFAILGQDTDYVILEGPHYYLSIAHLDLDMLTTRNYNRNILARHLHLYTSQLPLFATLCGNDIISSEDLEKFHKRLPPCSRGRVPFQYLFPRVADYVRRYPKGRDVVPHLQRISMEIFSNYKWEDKFKTSLFSYWASESQCGQEPPPFIGDDKWDAILKRAQERHIRCVAHAGIYSVMIGEPFYLTLVLEDFRSKNIPAAGRALQSMRTRLYGLLLKEKPVADKKKLFVKEWIMLGEDSLKSVSKVTPSFPNDHPGLLNLWDENDKSKETEEARWISLCWAVSKKLKFQDFFRVPKDLVVPVLALYYLHHELKTKFLEKFEIEAFLAQAINVNKLSHEDILRFPDVTNECDARAVHLSTLFQRTCTELDQVSSACGNPISKWEAAVSNYLDGKIFHYTYLKCKNGTPGNNLCGFHVSQIENYNYCLNIIMKEQ